MSSGTQRELTPSSDERTFDHKTHLDEEQRRWIRKHIRTVQEMLTAPSPFKFSDLDSDLPTSQAKMAKSGIVNKVPGSDPAEYKIVNGVRSYTEQWEAQEFEFDCCPYPDAFVNREGMYYCKYCFQKLEEHEVREANL